MDVTNLVLQLQSKITNDPLDQQMISKAIKLLQLGAVETVDSVTFLPPVVENIGRLYLVLYDGLYWGTVNGWVAIARSSYTLALGWGCNSVGRLGDGTIVDRCSPVTVIGGFTDWRSISSGCVHTVGLRQNGTLWAWGYNSLGRLGNNNTTNASSPVSVVGGFTDWCQASAGGSHTAAIRQNGTLWAWGSNTTGTLGDCTAISRSSPVSVVGGFTDWCQVSAGHRHNLAVRTNGTLWAWGYNSSGRLGDGTCIDKSSPVSVVGGFTDWCQASAGCSHSLAVRQDGTLWAWGANLAGALGTGNVIGRNSPVSVVGGFTDWCQASAGNAHSLAVRQDGTLWAWGCNNVGQLGDGTITSRSSPVSVVGGFTDWCQASAAGTHSVAIRQNGTLWAWGCNVDGRLGNGTVVSVSSPVSVVGGFTDWCQVSAGNFHTMAIRNNVT